VPGTLPFYAFTREHERMRRYSIPASLKTLPRSRAVDELGDVPVSVLMLCPGSSSPVCEHCVVWRSTQACFLWRLRAACDQPLPCMRVPKSTGVAVACVSSSRAAAAAARIASGACHRRLALFVVRPSELDHRTPSFFSSSPEIV
jgi:hypothetical protein